MLLIVQEDKYCTNVVDQVLHCDQPLQYREDDWWVPGIVMLLKRRLSSS